MEYFHDILQRNEIFLPEVQIPTESAFILSARDVNKSFRRLEQALRLESHHLSDFVEGLKEFLSNYNSLYLSISRPVCMIDDESNNNHITDVHFGQSDTFIKLLLRIQALQEPLMGYLIEKMIELSTNTSFSENFDMAHASTKILNHIRWCDIIYDSKSLLDKLMESVPILPRSLQIELISSLPGLASDNDQIPLVCQLKEVTETIPELIPCVLDTVTNLCLPAQSRAAKMMIRHAIQLLGSEEHSVLPGHGSHLNTKMLLISSPILTNSHSCSIQSLFDFF